MSIKIEKIFELLQIKYPDMFKNLSDDTTPDVGGKVERFGNNLYECYKNNRYKGWVKEYAKFYKVYYEPLRKVSKANEISIIFASALFVIYNENNQLFKIFGELGNSIDVAERNNRINMSKVILSKLPLYMYLIEKHLYENDLKDARAYSQNGRNKISEDDFLCEREISYFKISKINIYENPRSYKEILFNNDEEYKEYYNKHKLDQSVLNSLFIEYMSKEDFKLLQEVHMPNRPFWDSIVATFLLTLNYLYKAQVEKYYEKNNYIELENNLNEIIDFIGMLSVQKRDIYLKHNKTKIESMYKDINNIVQKFSDSEAKEFNKRSPLRLCKDKTEIFHFYDNLLTIQQNQNSKIHIYYMQKIYNIITHMRNIGKTDDEISADTNLSLKEIENIILSVENNK